MLTAIFFSSYLDPANWIRPMVSGHFLPSKKQQRHIKHMYNPLFRRSCNPNPVRSIFERQCGISTTTTRWLSRGVSVLSSYDEVIQIERIEKNEIRTVLKRKKKNRNPFFLLSKPTLGEIEYEVLKRKKKKHRNAFFLLSEPTLGEIEYEKKKARPVLKKLPKKKIVSNVQRICTDCGTTRTPLWRHDKFWNSLCNACGLWYFRHGKTHKPEYRKNSDSHDSDDDDDLVIPRRPSKNPKKRKRPYFKQPVEGQPLKKRRRLFVTVQ